MAKLSTQIQSLIAYANETTGNADTTLGDAVKALADGYKRSRLPDEYQEVEYLESTGTQYIDTGVFPEFENDFTIEVSYKSNKLKGESFQSILGVTESTLDAMVGWYVYIGNAMDVSAKTGSSKDIVIKVLNVDVGSRHRYRLKYNELLIDEKSYSEKFDYYAPTKTIGVFARIGNYKEGYSYSKGLMYYVKIFNNNGGILHFVPCYRKSDHKAGMYDLVSGKFFVNQGTGDDFILGPEVYSSTPALLSIDDAESLSSQIASLIAFANGVTGKSDATIGDAVRSLVEGYDSGVPEGFVDLGLPSGTLWADRNLGADAPHLDGLYFQWGATTGHEAGEGYNFASDNYPQSGISGDLDASQDAARAFLGGDCSMPSKEDFAELAANCHMERVTNYNGTGVAGVIFYSCKDNATGKGLYNSAGTWYAWNGSDRYNSSTSKPANFVPYTLDTPHVFFPASGDYYGSSLYSRGSYGYYWSRSFKSSSYAYYLFFNSSIVYPQDGNGKYIGFSVRAIFKP